MNKLKAIFAAVYVPLVGLITIVAIFEIFASGFDIGWIGVFLATAPVFAGILWSAITKKIGRLRPSLPVLTGLGALGFLLTLYRYLSENGSIAALGLVTFGLVSFLLFNFWYSRYGRRLNPLLEVGKKLPFFEAEDLQGQRVSSSSLLGKPALLMFYRGNWCPFCSAQVQEQTHYYKEMAERGVRVVLISPQPTSLTRRVADLYNVPIQYWVDKDFRAARALDILHKEGVPYGHRAVYGSDTVLPTVIIVDENGQIIFTDQTRNYRARPKPEQFLDVVAAHQART